VLFMISVAYAVISNGNYWLSEAAAIDTLVLLFKFLIILAIATGLYSVKNAFAIAPRICKVLEIFILGMFIALLWFCYRIGLNSTFIIPIEIFGFDNISFVSVIVAIYMIFTAGFLMVRMLFSLFDKTVLPNAWKVITLIAGILIVYLLIRYTSINTASIIHDEMSIEEHSSTTVIVNYRMLSGPPIKLQIGTVDSIRNHQANVLYTHEIDRQPRGMYFEPYDTDAISVTLTKPGMRQVRVDYHIKKRNEGESYAVYVAADTNDKHGYLMLLTN